jgi:hypothetical protein
MNKSIKDKIIKSDFVKWKSFKFIQPENFKELREPEYKKLEQSIINNNLIESFKVWQSGKTLYCLDGYHRCKIFQDLEGKGYNVPQEVRADFIDCKDRSEASKLVMIYSSIYANITDEGLYEFLNKEGLNFDDLKMEIDLPSINLDYFGKGYVQDHDIDKYFETDIEPTDPPKKTCPNCGYEL